MMMMMTSSKNSSRFVKHERPLVNPCWLPFITLYSLKCSTTLSLIILSITLHTTLVRLTGLLLHGSLLFPFLNNGTMRASLHSCGTSPVCIDLLKIWANASPISSLTSCKNFGCRSSIPGLLSVFSLFSCSTTFSLVNIICVNPFPLSKHVKSSQVKNRLIVLEIGTQLTQPQLSLVWLSNVN